MAAFTVPVFGPGRTRSCDLTVMCGRFQPAELRARRAEAGAKPKKYARSHLPAKTDGIQFTERGKAIACRYGPVASARRHLERMTHSATFGIRCGPENETPAPAGAMLTFAILAHHVMDAYRDCAGTFEPNSTFF